MIKPLIACGLELEIEYNAELTDHIEKDSYHGRNPVVFNSFFYAESDSSLSAETFPDGYNVELISSPFEIHQHKKILASFQKEMYDRVASKKGITAAEARKRYALKDIISFNDSMGAHLHFSVLRPTETETTISFKRRNPKFKGAFIPLKWIISPAFCERFNSKLLTAVKNLYPELSAEFSAQYYRGHAKSLKNEPEAIRTHYGNWSIDSKEQDIEIRGFNLMGVKTWKQFKGMYNIFLTLLYQSISAELRRPKAFIGREEYTAPPQTPRPHLRDTQTFQYNKNQMWTTTDNSYKGRLTLRSTADGITGKSVYEITINPHAPPVNHGQKCAYCDKKLKPSQMYFCRESCRECGLSTGYGRCEICGIRKGDLLCCSEYCAHIKNHGGKAKSNEVIAHAAYLTAARHYYMNHPAERNNSHEIEEEYNTDYSDDEMTHQEEEESNEGDTHV